MEQREESKFDDSNEKVKNKRPILITIIAICMIIFGVLSIIFFFASLLIFSMFLSAIYSSIISGIFSGLFLEIAVIILLLLGPLNIVWAIFLLKMKKMALYAFTFSFLLSLLCSIILGSDMTTTDYASFIYIIDFVACIIMFYLWSIKKQFV